MKRREGSPTRESNNAREHIIVNKHQLEQQRYDRAWNERRTHNREQNLGMFTGWRAGTRGVNYYEHGASGRQSKKDQKKLAAVRRELAQYR